MSDRVDPPRGRIQVRDRRPLYVQVAERIRAEFAVSPGSANVRLPAEMALAERYQVSRATVREAHRLLEQEGTIFARHGVGTFVSSQTGRSTYTFDSAGGGGSVLISQGEEEPSELLGYTLLPLSRLLRDRFNWPGDTLVRLERVRRREFRVVSYGVEIVPAAFVGGTLEQDSLDDPLAIVMSRNGFPVHHSDSVLSAAAAPTRVQKQMDASPHKPVIRSVEVMYDSKGQVLAFLLEYLDASAISFRIRRRTPS